MTVDIICPLYNSEDTVLSLKESIEKQKNVLTELEEDLENAIIDGDYETAKTLRKKRVSAQKKYDKILARFHQEQNQKELLVGED